jgi:hypothetical protein
MQNNRDSSVLRSLAIAFGDGLAFGVGMKLTQRGAAPSREEAPAAADITPLLDRLAEMEARIGEMERAPAAIAPSPFDQKVLEAIVKALDSRLQEQAGQMERRLTEMEAKTAIELKSLQQRSDEERAAMQQEIASLHREFAVEAAQAVETRTAELRAEISSRDSQIAGLQARLEVGDERLRNVVKAIAQACDTVVGHSAARSKEEPERLAETAAEPPLPNFAQAPPPARSLPVPLASSLALVSAALFAMMHYLWVALLCCPKLAHWRLRC